MYVCSYKRTEYKVCRRQVRVCITYCVHYVSTLRTVYSYVHTYACAVLAVCITCTVFTVYTVLSVSEVLYG